MCTYIINWWHHIFIHWNKQLYNSEIAISIWKNIQYACGTMYIMLKKNYNVPIHKALRAEFHSISIGFERLIAILQKLITLLYFIYYIMQCNKTNDDFYTARSKINDNFFQSDRLSFLSFSYKTTRVQILSIESRVFKTKNSD